MSPGIVGVDYTSHDNNFIIVTLHEGPIEVSTRLPQLPKKRLGEILVHKRKKCRDWRKIQKTIPFLSLLTKFTLELRILQFF